MRRKFFTLLMGLIAFGMVNAQTEIFNPATYDGELKAGMEVVEIDGVSYLQVVVDGWNSAIDIPEVSNILGTQLTGTMKYSQGSSTIAADLTLADINSSVQMMDTVNTVPPSWDPDALVPAASSLIQSPTVEGWHFVKCGITKEMELVHQIQFFGQETVNWGPTVGDTIWVSRIISVDASILFDPATVDAATLPDGMEIVDEGGEKVLKVKLNGWESNLPITPFEVGDNNKMKFKMKYEAGDSGIDNANAQAFVQATDESGGLFSGTANPAPADLTEIEADAKSNTTVTGLQIAAQETSGDWPAVTDAYLYVSKITVSFEEAQMATAPITTTLAYSDAAKDIAIDGLYDDAYGENENVVNQVALNETDGDISETDSHGVFLLTADLENFYLYAEINDDDPIELGESTSPWMNDGIELFMDIQNRRYVGGSRISGEQHQFRINYGTEGPAIGEFGMDLFFGDSDTTNIEFAVISSSSGYVVEARVPWATWYRTNSNNGQDALDAIDLAEGMKVAFEISVVDANAIDARKSILNWANNTGEDKAYSTNEFWGEVELKGGWPVGISQEVAYNNLVVYPNPATAELNIDMNNAATAEIYNVIGAKVDSKNLSGLTTVDVSNLSMGVYILKVTDMDGNISVAKFSKK